MKLSVNKVQELGHNSPESVPGCQESHKAQILGCVFLFAQKKLGSEPDGATVLLMLVRRNIS